jgi:hypothetical protein
VSTWQESRHAEQGQMRSMQMIYLWHLRAAKQHTTAYAIYIIYIYIYIIHVYILLLSMIACTF